MSVKKLLAIDYGTVRVGLAVSYGSLAEPYRILPNDDHLVEEIGKICQELKITKIVVGISENQMAEKSKVFAKEIEDKLGLTVELSDETLSSYEVATILKDKPLKLRKKPIDHLAAAIILQNFLDSQPREN